MNFGQAIELLKDGKRVMRAGWNGKGMWIALTPASSFAAPLAKDGHAARHLANDMTAANNPHGSIQLTAHIDMKAADGSLVVGWLASQTDMLAEDWSEVLVG